MKLWVDDVRIAPLGAEWAWARNIYGAMLLIMNAEFRGYPFELIDIDHDTDDYIKLLDWLEKTKRNYPIHIHNINLIGVQNMRAILQKNGWIEVK